MKINPLLLLPPVLLAGFVAFVAVGNFREDRNDLPSARAGHQAPAVALAPLEELPLFTDDMLRTGEVTLVNFWASWCPPCRAEAPVVEALAHEGLTVLGVNYRDEPDRAMDFLDELGNPYAAIGADPRARMGLDWGVVGLPETFVVDGEGNILMRHAGPLTEEVVEQRLRPVIERAQGRAS
ncbi:DsbE family thiol:disulfide interchange protein [Pararhodobacter aggregans]|uniref:DsbE family thiol:disulfide interchange protein n=1 Tax=Pararhodobacter aggregans TaxID=404875 RepID=A0A2T7UMX2_9RHOB|nr:DsbE family thiol:disulfide interchange protein [Pararhodobacter aggregans]PTX02442.1 cytochrome c biogenesis protein CcmG/thiol:disulfide interchange protein DsbE [Pararhodobacter aggregans]PVE46053.1 DsbE family thiol:disulfide interchange protein [Pararhodobacter aggregans]